MFTKTHQGIVKKTVVLEFENGYQIELTAGVEMCMHLVMDEAQIKAAQQSVQRTAGMLPQPTPDNQTTVERQRNTNSRRR